MPCSSTRCPGRPPHLPFPLTAGLPLVGSSSCCANSPIWAAGDNPHLMPPPLCVVHHDFRRGLQLRVGANRPQKIAATADIGGCHHFPGPGSAKPPSRAIPKKVFVVERKLFLRQYVVKSVTNTTRALSASRNPQQTARQNRIQSQRFDDVHFSCRPLPSSTRGLIGNAHAALRGVGQCAM